MSDLESGPVEFLLIGYPGERPETGVADAIRGLVRDGDVRVIDALVIHRSAEGDVTADEVVDAAELYGLENAGLEEAGLATDEDIEEFAELLEPGGSAEFLAVEVLWEKKLAARLAESGARVIAGERIPADVVGEVLHELHEE
jgi:uncharacterized membrane protein